MNPKLSRKRVALVAASLAVVTAGTVGAAVAVSGEDDARDRPIPASALEEAEEAALAETGQGTVTGTEVDDEDSKYEVEVTLDDGSHVDVQLDEDFQVVGTEADGTGEEPDADDD
jgi:uncharacterized membrane protein YkoI